MARNYDHRLPRSRIPMQGLNLNEQEQNLYRHHLHNLGRNHVVKNDDGSRSTVRQMTIEQDGRVYNVPTVWDGKVLSPYEARQKAGRLHRWPSYDSEEEAESRYNEMHGAMEMDME